MITIRPLLSALALLALVIPLSACPVVRDGPLEDDDDDQATDDDDVATDDDDQADDDDDVATDDDDVATDDDDQATDDDDQATDDDDQADDDDAGDDDVSDDDDAGDDDDVSGLPADPAEAGSLWVTESADEITVNDGWSDITIPMDVYVPDGPGPYPAVIFTHGFQLGPGNYASWGEHLASWGYVAVLPQMPGDMWSSPTHTQLKEYLVAIIDRVESEGPVPTGDYAGMVDPSSIALAGHSMGGKISLLVASEDARVDAVFGVDPVDAAGGPFSSDGPDYPSVTPELMPQITVPIGMVGETTNSTGMQPCAPADNNFEQYFAAATSPAIAIDVLGAFHMSFLDDSNCGLPCWACPAGTDDPAVTLEISRGYLVAFLESTLRADPDYLGWLTGPGMAEDVNAGLVTYQSTL